ncbi:TetR/AcrR family transcriptional regulator [Curtobacterium sp. VKM Ac-2884]|uniref:TetR/AcrR family transcriptional regulator n=1 Tax=Curtobacterium sp. VKM Ac-2884 TaxID=2783818 RepID=UPI00188A8F18|nr:TetR/AcrR family transcriptional regulator [Curtobacterium sp. VKM Ac-2884]MBF4603407.1 TetR/AcrR family transcriptional regulator [Curtobacterium sp. VKM Ac-2884]
MNKRGRPTTDERVARDERILDVATDLFLEHGFAGVALDRVAAEAGVTKRTLYTAFGDKPAILRAVVRRQHPYAAQPAADLLSTAAAIGSALLSDRAVALHRLVIAESTRSPELAREFHEAGPLAAQQALVRAGATPDTAAELFTLLLGELHRQRLLGLAPAPTAAAVAARAARAVALLST